MLTRNGRLAIGAIAVVAFAAVVLLVGGGAPSNLDHQEQVASARGCTSLIERNVAQATPSVRALADNPGENEILNLDDPTSFYATLQKYRGPSTFDFHDPDKAASSPKDMLDNPCKLKTPSSK